MTRIPFVNKRFGLEQIYRDILVGPETAKRIKDEIPIFDRGPMRFKNIKEEVRVYSLIHSDETS